MQTFLPSSSFSKSAKLLDWQRLGKQRVEARDILYCVHRHNNSNARVELGLSVKAANFLWKRYRHHPAVLMWVDDPCALAHYGSVMCREWLRRGYVDNLLHMFLFFSAFQTKPVWLGNRLFHRSHQANLVRKMPEHYRPMFPGVRRDLPYIWPVTKENFYESH